MNNQTNIWKILKYIAGWTLIVLGVIGLFLPFLQGILMIIAGGILLENKQIIEFVKSMQKKWEERKFWKFLRKKEEEGENGSGQGKTDSEKL